MSQLHCYLIYALPFARPVLAVTDAINARSTKWGDGLVLCHVLTFSIAYQKVSFGLCEQGACENRYFVLSVHVFNRNVIMACR